MLHNHWTAIVRFELATQLRQPEQLIAAFLVIAFGLAGLLVGRGEHAATFFGYGYLGSLALRLGTGLGTDRQAHHDVLMANFLGPAALLSGKLLALWCREILFALLSLIVAFVLLQSGATAVWHVALFSLFAILVYPLVLLVEMVGSTRVPGALGLILAFVLLMLFARVAGTRDATFALGLTVTPGSFASLTRLALVSFATGVGGTLLLCLVWLMLNRQRGFRPQS